MNQELPQLEVDREANAAYINLMERDPNGDVARTIELGYGINVDLNSNNEILGYEIMSLTPPTIPATDPPRGGYTFREMMRAYDIGAATQKKILAQFMLHLTRASDFSTELMRKMAREMMTEAEAELLHQARELNARE